MVGLDDLKGLFQPKWFYDSNCRNEFQVQEKTRYSFFKSTFCLMDPYIGKTKLEGDYIHLWGNWKQLVSPVLAACWVSPLLNVFRKTTFLVRKHAGVSVFPRFEILLKPWLANLVSSWFVMWKVQEGILLQQFWLGSFLSGKEKHMCLGTHSALAQQNREENLGKIWTFFPKWLKLREALQVYNFMTVPAQFCDTLLKIRVDD